MENKTVSYLNGKAWYRLLKVVYVFAFLLVSLVAVVVVYDFYSARQVNDYRVVCNYGSKTNFLAHEDKGIYLNDYELRNGLTDIPDYEKESLQKACGMSEDDVRSSLNAILDEGKDLVAERNPFTRAEKVIASHPLFAITKERVTVGGPIDVMGYSLLTVFVISLVFEVARRVFYYVVLGNIKPTK